MVVIRTSKASLGLRNLCAVCAYGFGNGHFQEKTFVILIEMAKRKQQSNAENLFLVLPVPFSLASIQSSTDKIRLWHEDRTKYKFSLGKMSGQCE